MGGGLLRACATERIGRTARAIRTRRPTESRLRRISHSLAPRCPLTSAAVTPDSPSTAGQPPLKREIGLWQGTALNVIDMVGIGPFVTLPLILGAMGGGRALLAWILGALLA